MTGELLSLNINWVKADGDCTTCNACQQPIYGVKYEAEINIEKSSQKLDVQLCEPCYVQKISQHY